MCAEALLSSNCLQDFNLRIHVSFEHRYFHSAQGRPILVVSKSRSVGPSPLCLSFPRSPRQKWVSRREEWREGHVELQARNRMLLSVWQPISRILSPSRTITRVYFSYSIIPQRERVGFPPEPDLVIRIFADLMEQEGKDSIGFSFRNANDTSGKAWTPWLMMSVKLWSAERTRVDVDTLPTSCWVNSDDRVDSFDFGSTDGETGCSGTLCLSDSTVKGSQTFKVLLEAGAQRGV